MADVLRCVTRALGQVRAHGGLRGSFWQILRVSDLKTGTLVGEDKSGNRYFENQRYFFGRNRWVEYTNEMNGKNTYWDLDGSMVPPEWHRWLHYMTDDAPSVHPPVSRPFIWETHTFNMSGTAGQYVPYSTTRKKIHQWVPPQSSRQ
ncbi:NADH dehydrogenase [ubiquinone] 1 alpha subcomplex subunit 12 [Callorhinchus milii]|uniref:NADH dehydrogenase [ubiquinone] 1 alpha subcomplex subunit 12 n=2 Tax=Callorhinchus milii TaxID=7868 RepID=V9LCW4_CALMI|nr:NADH dehydrogenase [ubiquinone] 1 alpha subcomplex subunit 12 [Callorhinchus milii]|eukprot:gi/632980720/ref/XP_007907192.1/ PREDICTED: NADH dehydrogenase [ubiquinone] 1 alpha subcomplex subunit 12 [Callorhinchus milii]